MSTTPGMDAKRYSSEADYADDREQMLRPNELKPTSQNRRRWLPWAMHGTLVVVYSAVFGLFVTRQAQCPLYGNREHYSPAADLLELETRVFDQGWGEVIRYPFQQTTNQTSGRVLYSGKPTPEMDELWEKLYHPPLLMRMSEQEAAGLDVRPDPLEDGSGYFTGLDVFHQLHCLDMIRKAAHPDQYPPWQTPEKTIDHTAHCVNYLRQVLVCHGDITPVSFKRSKSYGPETLKFMTAFDAPRQCRNYEKIYNWAMERRLDLKKDHDLIYYDE